MLGRIIEDMAYFSSETVRPAYYEMMLAGKLARAEEDSRDARDYHELDLV